MFDKQSCILCLEKANNTSDRINIDANDPEAVNARGVIERHFKDEVKLFETRIPSLEMRLFLF